MAFSHSLNSPNGEFKTKKHPSFSGVDLLKNPLYTNGVRRLCFIFATANASLRNEMTLLHLKRLYYEAHLAAHEAHFVLASFARQASKYMKRHSVP